MRENSGILADSLVVIEMRQCAQAGGAKSGVLGIVHHNFLGGLLERRWIEQLQADDAQRAAARVGAPVGKQRSEQSLRFRIARQQAEGFVFDLGFGALHGQLAEDWELSGVNVITQKLNRLARADELLRGIFQAFQQSALRVFILVRGEYV